MNIELKKYVDKAISYTEYNAMFQQLVAEGRTTGNEQTFEKIDFTKLNWSRTKRLDKTASLSEEAIKEFKNLNSPQTWLVITEAWCGDAAQSIPFLNKIAQLSDNIDLKFVLRDENDALMNAFLTNGSKSIPKLIILDKNHTLLNTWGPRSAKATKLVNDYKAMHGKLDAEFKKDLQVWYNKDKGEAIINDILSLIKASSFVQNISE